MASKPRSLDVGPMHLPIGQDDGPVWSTQPSAADANDVARFASLMNEGRGRRQDAEPALDGPPGPLAAPEIGSLADEGDLGAEIEHLWVGTGLTSAREVRVGLRESLLPDTSVRLYESQGRLRIEFTCITNRVAFWLSGKLPALARELGGRLDREIELAIYMGDGSLAGERDWPGGGR